MKLDKMVVLAEYNSLLEAEMAKSILDSFGIWTMIHNEYMSTMYPTGVMPAQLIVMEEDLARSRKCLCDSQATEDDKKKQPVDA